MRLWYEKYFLLKQIEPKYHYLIPKISGLTCILYSHLINCNIVIFPTIHTQMS